MRPVDRLFRLGKERKRIVGRLHEIDEQLPDAIQEGREEGLSYAEIADLVGLTRQRVHQIMRNREVG